MSLLMQLDNRTLLVCLFVSAALFALAFARTWTAHRSLRGAGSFAFAFSCAAVGCLLFVVVPASTPWLQFIDTVVGDSLVCYVFAFLLAGIERFLGVQQFSRMGWLVVGVGALSIFFLHGVPRLDVRPHRGGGLGRLRGSPADRVRADSESGKEAPSDSKRGHVFICLVQLVPWI
jgi:hypothetical protein